MNKTTIILKLISFLVFLLIINFLLDAFYKKVVTSETINMRKDREFYSLDDTLTFLFIGDSHFQNGVNPLLLGESYNFSSANENIIQSYYKLKYILEETDKQLNFVLLPLDLSSFNVLRSTRFKYNEYWVKYIDYKELASVKHDKSYYFAGLAARYMSYAGNYETIYRFFISEEKRNSKLILGYRPKYENFQPQKPRKEVTDLHELLYKSTDYFEPDIVNYMERIMDLCAGNSLKLVLVKMPVSAPHFEKMTQVVDTLDFDHRINLMLAERKNIFVLDYQKIYFDKPLFFNNPDHLNDNGASDFTLILKKDLYKIKNAVN